MESMDWHNFKRKWKVLGDVFITIHRRPFREKLKLFCAALLAFVLMSGFVGLEEKLPSTIGFSLLGLILTAELVWYGRVARKTGFSFWTGRPINTERPLTKGD